MQLSDLNKYKSIFFNVSVVIFIALVMFNFLYKKELNAKQHLIIERDLEIKKNMVLSSISTLEKKINIYKKSLEKKDAGSVINSIGEIARESGVKIISIRPEREQIYPEYVKLPFDLALNSPDYHAIGIFMSKLENYRDVYRVDSLNIASIRQAEGLTANIKFSSIAFAE